VIPSLLRQPEALGDYQLARVIATGELARLYEAHRTGPHGFEKRVALRRIRPEAAIDAHWVGCFTQEAQRLAALSHPNLVQIVDFGARSGELFLALEYVDGMTALALVERVAARRRRVEPGVALFVVREVLRGLEYLHAAQDGQGRPLGLVHGAVDPRHVLIGSAGQVKLGDFALRRASERWAREVSSATGRSPAGPSHRPPPGYGSPEQLQGRPIDRRSDLFGAGVLLAELLLTRPLFAGGAEEEAVAAVLSGDLSALRVYGWHLTDDIRRVLESALQVNPRERYQTASEFRADVERALVANQGPSSGHEFVEWLSSLGLVELESGVLPVARNRPSAAVTRSSYRPTQARQYRLASPDGAVEGPLTAAALLGRIATGRLPDTVMVSRGDDDFVPLTALPELQGLWSRHPYRFHDPQDPSAADHPIELGSLAPHLLSLALGKRTGLLRADSGDHQARIYFEAGHPVFSSSTDPASLLGAQLVASGVVSPGTIESALARGWRRDEPLGATLVLKGFLSAAALQSALESQMERRLTQVARLRAGRLVFYPGARSAMPNVPLLRSGPALVTRAILHAYSTEELGRVLMPYWHDTLRASSRSQEAFALLELDAAEGYWLQRAMEGASLAVLTNEAAGDRGQIATVLGVVLIGLATGLLVP
jgi:serine/threonine-protein kinase